MHGVRLGDGPRLGSYTGEGGRKEDHFKDLRDLPEKLVHAGPLADIDGLENIFAQMDGNDQIGIRDGLKGAVNEGFIQIED